jgi:hypothetical protein
VLAAYNVGLANVDYDGGIHIGPLRCGISRPWSR